MIAGSKPSVNEEVIRYQARTKLAALAGEIAGARKLDSSSVKAKIKQATQIRLWLKALDYKEYLTREQREKIYYALIDIADINDFPTAPLLELRTTPNILIGVPSNVPGDDGEDGEDGEDGATGLAKDFTASNLTFSVAVDQFLVTDAHGARWDYIVYEDGGATRVGSVIGGWNPSTLALDFVDTATADITASTAGLEFEVQISSGNVYLVAIITSGNWEVRGTRYFIPNNGDGTGPISGVLADGHVYIGNSSNTAQARLLSGAITTNNLGVTTLGVGVVADANVASGAAIAVNKLAALAVNSAVVTDANGFLTTAAGVSATEIGYLANVTSDIQTQINTKMTDPMTTIGDIIIRNGANATVRLGIGSASQVLTVVGGVPVWATPASGFADPMTTSGDIIIRSGGTTTRLGIGSSGQVLTVSGGLPSWQTPTSYVDPLTTNGDLLVRAGGVTTRLAAGSANQFLTTSGSASSWTTITAGATNELQKNGGSGLLTSSNVFATATGLGVGVASPSYKLHVQDSTSGNLVSALINTSTGQSEFLLQRTGGVASAWSLYIPPGTTELRVYSATDLFSFTTAGKFVASSLQATGLSSGRVVIVGASGLLTDDSDLTFTDGGAASKTLIVGGAFSINGGTTNQGISWSAGSITGNGIAMGITAVGNFSFSGGGGSPTASWNSIRHTNAANPIGAQDLVTKSYLENTFSANPTGGFTFVDGDFTAKTNINTMSGTGTYVIVGEVVHVFGVVYGTLPTSFVGAVSFRMPLGNTSDFLYGGGGDAVLVGTGWSVSSATEYRNWGFNGQGTNLVQAQLVTETNVGTAGTVTIWFHYSYRRIDV